MMNGNPEKEHFLSDSVELLIKAGIDKEDARFDVTFLYDALGGNHDAFTDAVYRRAGGEPCAYILGSCAFYKEEYEVGPGVLIPRSDTEILVEAALKALGALDFPVGDIINIPTRDERPDVVRIADLCCGSGCIGISLTNALADSGISCHTLLGDISPIALEYSRENARLQLKAGGEKVDIVQVDLLSPKSLDNLIASLGTFDLIVSNPPYITDSEMEELPREVRDYEPELALRGDGDGLLFYRTLASNAEKILSDGGILLVEHGYLQGEAVRRIFAMNGLTDIITVKDYGGNDRVTYGRFSASDKSFDRVDEY